MFTIGEMSELIFPIMNTLFPRMCPEPPVWRAFKLDPYDISCSLSVISACPAIALCESGCALLAL